MCDGMVAIQTSARPSSSSSSWSPAHSLATSALLLLTLLPHVDASGKAQTHTPRDILAPRPLVLLPCDLSKCDLPFFSRISVRWNCPLLPLVCQVALARSSSLVHSHMHSVNPFKTLMNLNCLILLSKTELMLSALTLQS